MPDDAQSQTKRDTLVPSSSMEDHPRVAGPPTMRRRKSSTVITVSPPPSPSTSAVFEGPVREMREAVPGCLAVAVVSIGRRHLLALELGGDVATEEIELVAGATAELYGGERVRAIEEAFRRSRGVAGGEGTFQEIVLTSVELLYVFLRSTQEPDVVALVVCEPKTSLGMALSASRTQWKLVQEALA